MRSTTLLIMLSTVLLTACLNSQSPDTMGRTNTASEYVITDYAGFNIEKLEHVSYKMIYVLQKNPGPSPSFMIEFENPATGRSSFQVKGTIRPGQEKFIVHSPELPGVSLKKSYQVTLRLLSMGKAVAVHQDQVRFDVPEVMLKRLKVNLYK